ncbi:polysaccharide pyruvyl transferase family protein [Metabacillus arenae]|uniref:Polysaccharide pyruvyl transferase family protein n=1 Tax=Metabacillus arenae TaxID=2771434 RepID=A0A926NL94_9BACI|nr:polysaccharide pyruvyl transferase family protein [Metabacillus arenae]MBD1382678.1 polysaccharide pyruvyl transferase family protein [Metabacillus arenae]
MRKYVVIVGGELFNKGAQALTFTAVDQIKTRFPNTQIVLLSSMDFKRPNEEKDKYAFEILPFSLDLKSDLLGGLYKSYDYLSLVINKRKASKDIRNKVKNIFKNSTAMIDISGFALSSQRGEFSSLQYLLNLKIARKYNIPTFLFPQSFGPFNYGPIRNLVFHKLIKKELSNVKKIYVREDDGMENLKKLGLNNIQRSYDIVLQNTKSYSKSNIYKSDNVNMKVNDLVIENSIGIIPNVKIMKHGNATQLYNLYYQLIDHLIKNNKNVYFLRHSYEDKEIIENIKQKFPQNKKIFYLDEDYSCIEIDEIIKKFNFIIGSRYHSIVHAYKNFVPAIVLGWAIKYDELLSAFDQNEFCFDVRGEIEVKDAIAKLDILLKSFEQERDIISKKYKEITTNNIFDKVNF